MSTLADELLNDFEDSGDENEDQTLQDHESANGLNGVRQDEHEDGMPEDAANDETMVEDDDEEEEKEFVQANLLEDEDETKAKVEKMHLGLVRDVRSVAGLMKTLQPVLDVSSCRSCIHVFVVYIYMF